MAILDNLLQGLSEENKKRAVLGAVALGTCLVSWSSIAQPALKQLKDIEQQKSFAQNKEPLLREVLTLESRLDSFSAQLLPDRELGPLMSFLADNAARRELKITSIYPDKNILSDPNLKIEELPILIEASGTFHQLGAFVADIENHSPFLKISRAEFAKTSASTAESASPVDSRQKKIYLNVSGYAASRDGVTP